MELSVQQQEFYNKIISLDFTKLLLTGEGGTGKTYVLVKALEALIEMEYNVMVCAPTHAARMNLLSKFSDEIQPKVINKTVASSLRRIGFKNDEGNTLFTSGTGDYLNKYDIIAIDEVSMLSQRDLEFFLKSSAKVICTGDPQQLPVVKQKKVDLKVFLENPEYDHIHLDEQMRQCGAIYTLAQRSRQAIYIPQPEDMDESQGLSMVPDECTLLDKYINTIENDEDYEVERYRYLCHSNEEALKVNEKIRQLLYSSSVPYVEGEEILLAETCELGYNSEVVKISQVIEHPLESWNTVYYEIHSGGSMIHTFTPQDWVRINAEIKEMRSQIRSLRENKHFEQANSFQAQIDFIKDNFSEVTYPYATTVHKSQGATIDHVFLNTVSLDKASNKRALFYVGISRASVSLTLVEVPLKQWQAQRQVNKLYKEARAKYEFVYNEKYYKLRDRFPHPCKTLDEKYYWAHMFLANAEIPMASHAIAMIPFRK